ncbi:MAG: hypothetical protein JWL70_1839 [Acidimicrobiia bacterium]|nr:hypothetical protein [Acidimicrobiia bacterium]
MNTAPDPVRVRRALVRRWAKLGKRTGYLLFLASIALFMVGFIGRFTSGLVSAIVTCLVVGSILLAPTIVLGYAVNAAEREDRAAGR